MSTIAAVQGYITKFIDNAAAAGMKALVLDRETTTIVSLVYSQSQIIAQEVFLTELIDSYKPKPDTAGSIAGRFPLGGGIEEKKGADPNMHHLKAVVFIRPTPKSIQALKVHLKQPRFKEYHVFFSNIVSEEDLRSIAESDQYEVVKQVQEYYADFLAVNPELFHAGLPRSKCLSYAEAYWSENDKRIFKRNSDCLTAFLLAMKRRPVVRFSKQFEITKRLAYEISRKMKEEAELFHFGHSQPNTVLLVLDRREDPMTPLLLQWTYQAMVHELLGIANNRVDMSKVPGIRKELREVVFSSDQDKFFRGSMNLNFGDLGKSVKDLVEEYQRKTKSNQKIVSIEDMQRFVDEYPEFRSMSGNVSKHVSVMSELSRLVELRDLLAVSEVEQELACQNDHSSAIDKVLKLLEDPRLTNEDRCRLVLLYSLRFEDQRNQIPTLKGILKERATDDRARKRTQVVDFLLNYAGNKARGGDQLSASQKLMDRMKGMLGGGLRGVENIYTQHKPALTGILDAMAKKTLKTNNYPFVDGGQQELKQVDEIFIYMVGGVTYEEALAVTTFNETNRETRVILGGSYIHNSTSFIDDVLGDIDGVDEPKDER